MKTFRKQPADHLDYQIDLSEWLVDGDEVVDAQIDPPTGIELTSMSIMPTRVKLWIKGGVSGKSYHFSPRIQTRHRVKEVDFVIAVLER